MNKLNNINSKQDHILACLSSAPSNAKIIRSAARMAKAFDSQFTALFVETPDFAVATDENKKRLEENRKLAEQLGATIETVYGDDIPYQIAEFARISGITRIVLGQSSAIQKHLFGKPTLTQLLLSYVPELDIHIIPDKAADTTYHPKKARKYHHEQIIKNTVKSALILFAATLLSLLFHEIGFTDANMIMVYILGVLLTSIATSHQIYSLISSIVSVFIFNYLFTAPRFSLAAYDTGYPVTFVVMFLTAYITGTLAIRYKEQARQSEKIAKRTKVLFDTDQLLSKAENKLAILQTAGQQINKLLGRSIVIFDHEGGRLSEPIRFISDGQQLLREKRTCDCRVGSSEQIIMPELQQRTSRMHSICILLFVSMNEYMVSWELMQWQVPWMHQSRASFCLFSVKQRIALENEKNIREKEAAAILAESEQLRANLLRAISHDLRTPLTTISGNAGNLLHNSHSFDDETKQQIYADIYDDSMWLTNLVENLLYSTRIEEGRMMLKTSPELVSEIIEEADAAYPPQCKKHSITVNYGDDLLMVRVDAKLIVQVIINLVDNALKYTPLDTLISISAECKNGWRKSKSLTPARASAMWKKEKYLINFTAANIK